MSRLFIAYFRVSTDRQGKSGLGLDAQLEAVTAYRRQVGGEIVASYREIESGKRADRPELAKAIAHAKRSGATLVIAKLDRLARNVAFVSALMESGADFVCCDNPHANRLTIHILAAVAEDEARRISDRTKAALAALKRRGVKLGAARPECRNLTDEARRIGAAAGGKAAREAALNAYSDLLPEIREWRSAGMSLREIADRLNQTGHTTRRGCQWNPAQVMRVLRRAPAS